MAYVEITPTPPTKDDGPYVTIQLPISNPVDYYDVKAGWYGRTPQIWGLEHLRVVLTTSADVANRAITLRHVHSSLFNTTYLWTVGGGNVAASSTGYLTVLPVANLATASINTYVGLSRPYLFQGDELMRLFVSAAQAADTWLAIYRLKYMNRELGMPTPYDE